MEATGTDQELDGAASDRRRFLKRSAIGGAAAGVAWATPALLSLDSAQACGTLACTGSTATFSWVTAYPAQAALAPVNAPGAGAIQVLPPAAAGGVTITTTRSDTTSQNTLTGGSWRIRGTAGGACGGSTEQLWHIAAPNSWLRCRMGDGNAGSAGAFVDTTIAFSQPVWDLAFSILDIDNVTSGNTYRDRVFISGTPAVSVAGAGPFSYTTLFQGSAVGVSPPLAAGGIGNASSEWYGAAAGAVLDCSTLDSGSPPIDTGGFAGTNGAGNLRICVDVPVTSVTIRHQRGFSNPPPANSGTALVSGQHIGVGNLTFCNSIV